MNSSTICFWLPLRKFEYVNFGGALIATVEEKFAARQSMILFMGGKDSYSYTETVMTYQGDFTRVEIECVSLDENHFVQCALW